mgnify:CR=1 FL=1
MISVLWTLPEAGAIIKPKPPPFRLFVRNPQPLTSPDPFDALVVHVPARVVQQTCHHAISIAAVLVGQLDDIVGQDHLVGPEAPLRKMIARNMTPVRTWKAYMPVIMKKIAPATPEEGVMPSCIA